jgi:CheY-like chemotaxis protein
MCDSELASWTVLIVEDEPHNLGVPEGILQHYGAQVFTAENGLEGLKVLADVTPTLILLDLSMPQMDGWEMIKRVRANPKMTNVPVVALTAHAWHRDKERVLAAGFDAVGEPVKRHQNTREDGVKWRKTGSFDGS